LDTLEIQVEMSPELPGDSVRRIEQLEKKVYSAIQSALGIGVELRLVPAGSIPRSEGKTPRTKDLRPKGDEL